MDENTAKKQIINTGINLLDKGLLVRTWGNISCRIDDKHMIITPSGLAYTDLTPDKLPAVCIDDLSWRGKYKPSSEKGIHASAYKIFNDAGFVIHTHQVYASAISVSGIDGLDITDEEQNGLGKLSEAEYGLPGTKKLRKAVESSMIAGNHVIIMKNHGAVIVGHDVDEAINRAILLEQICKRNIKGIESSETGKKIDDVKKDKLASALSKKFKYFDFITTDAVITQSLLNKPIRAQLDDMAQMIGRYVPVAIKEDKIINSLNKYHAVLVPGFGGIVSGKDIDDTVALGSLLNKSAVTARHTDAIGKNNHLSIVDCSLMHIIYTKKYSKKKNNR